MSEKYSELLEDRIISDSDVNMEWDRIKIIWEDFFSNNKTLGVENIYPFLLDMQNKEKKDFLSLKCQFKDLVDYSSEGFRNEPAKDKIKNVHKHSNEPSSLRVYSFLENISLLGGYKPDTWVSRKELSVAGHMSPTSIRDLGEALYSEKFIEKFQDAKSSETRGSILYKLNKKGTVTLGRTDSHCNKLDSEAWRGFKQFLSERIDVLRDRGYVHNVHRKITYPTNDEKLSQELVYTKKKLKESYSVIGTVGNRLLMFES